MSENETQCRQLEQLKEAARIFLRPMERLPFSVVVEAMTGRQVLPAQNCRVLLQAISASCISVIGGSADNPIRANRPNDVSVQVERRLEQAMKQEGVHVEIPRAARGRGGGGYPDRFLRSEECPVYLEIKVSREQNINQGSARNFFYQPVADTKILEDAPHLLVGFTIRESGDKLWTLCEWTIVDLFFLRVRLKPEYNADNLEIYRPEGILMKGDGTSIFVGTEHCR